METVTPNVNTKEQIISQVEAALTKPGDCAPDFRETLIRVAFDNRAAVFAERINNWRAFLIFSLRYIYPLVNELKKPVSAPKILYMLQDQPKRMPYILFAKTLEDYKAALSSRGNFADFPLTANQRETLEFVLLEVVEKTITNNANAFKKTFPNRVYEYLYPASTLQSEPKKQLQGISNRYDSLLELTRNTPLYATVALSEAEFKRKARFIMWAVNRSERLPPTRTLIKLTAIPASLVALLFPKSRKPMAIIVIPSFFIYAVMLWGNAIGIFSWANTQLQTLERLVTESIQPKEITP